LESLTTTADRIFIYFDKIRLTFLKKAIRFESAADHEEFPQVLEHTRKHKLMMTRETHLAVAYSKLGE
jgi:hypothetical protein